MYIYLLLAFIGILAIKFRKNLTFILALFYTFYICLIWNSIVRLPVAGHTVHV